MANEVIIATLSAITLTSSGASAASNAFATAGYSLAASAHSGYTGCDLVFTGTLAASNASNSNYFNVYLRPINIDGTADAPQPGSSFTGGFVGALQFSGTNASGGQTAILTDVPNSWADVEFWIENKTNASLNANWTLKAIPKTVKPL